MKNNIDSRTIAIIGGGPAGMECASQLKTLGYKCVIIEKGDKLGGNLNNWDRLFPEGIEAQKVVKELAEKTKGSKLFLNSTIKSVKQEKGKYNIVVSGKDIVEADSVIICTGFDLFPAEKKEEYGYNIYNHVITNRDLEQYFKKRVDSRIQNPSKIGFVHCVGSRDEKVCNRHCSKLCCVTAVKQAIELKEIFPQSEIICFYMDLRMFGRGYEDIYHDAQYKYGIRFIRGRVSEVSENIEMGVVVKAEDTLQSKPIKITLDLLVLMSGMMNSHTASQIAEQFDAPISNDGFFEQSSRTLSKNSVGKKGIFIAGTSTGPKTLPETLNDARGVVLEVHQYLSNL